MCVRAYACVQVCVRVAQSMPYVYMRGIVCACVLVCACVRTGTEGGGGGRRGGEQGINISRWRYVVQQFLRALPLETQRQSTSTQELQAHTHST